MARQRIKKRGRPRSYDTEQVLEQAMKVFWTQGFSGTSLDDLSSAMSMNRPSIYNAFGDKEGVYRAALAQFTGHLRQSIGTVLFEAPSLSAALDGFFESALDVYLGGDPAPGCFVMSTAPSLAISHPDVRTDVKAVIDEIDGVLAKRFTLAKRQGEVGQSFKPRSAARLTQAVLHSLALRARAGEGRPTLSRMARESTRTILQGTA